MSLAQFCKHGLGIQQSHLTPLDRQDALLKLDRSRFVDLGIMIEKADPEGLEQLDPILGRETEGIIDHELCFGVHPLNLADLTQNTKSEAPDGIETLTSLWLHQCGGFFTPNTRLIMPQRTRRSLGRVAALVCASLAGAATSGCALWTVADATVSVAATAVKTTVSIAGAAVSATADGVAAAADWATAPSEPEPAKLTEPPPCTDDQAMDGCAAEAP